MRGEFYVWSDGANIHIDAHRPQLDSDWPSRDMAMMPLQIFDELVAMRWAQLATGERVSAMKRAVANYSGNVGCDALCKAMGKKGFTEQLQELAAEIKKERKQK